MGDRGISTSELLVWDDVPPMFTFDDPDGNRFYVVADLAASPVGKESSAQR